MGRSLSIFMSILNGSNGHDSSLIVTNIQLQIRTHVLFILIKNLEPIKICTFDQQGTQQTLTFFLNTKFINIQDHCQVSVQLTKNRENDALKFDKCMIF